MISRAKAIQILQEYWETDRLVFQADFHIPKNIKLREGTLPFGYFRNFRLNGEIIDYPLEYGDKHDRRISIKYIIKNGLEDNQRYEVSVVLNNDTYRKNNPFSLIVKSFKKLTESPVISKNLILDNTIKKIFEEKINISSPFTMVELANSVESLATDIYSENKRFIYELIQNADDAATDDNAELSIDILNNYVVISHNGAPFDSRDLRGLCSIGIGTKSDDASKTGYKGIGFKSVFGQPEGIVYVKTEDTLFRFDRDFASKKAWNAKWGNKEDWEKKNRIIFNCPWQMMPILSKQITDVDLQGLLNNNDYSVKTVIKIKDRASIYNDIIDLFDDAKFMLFLRKVKSVHLNSNENQVHLEKVKHKLLTEVVSLEKNGKLLSNWFVKKWKHDIPPNIQKELKSDLKTPKKIQYMENTEISFAFKLNEENNEIQALKENQSPIYSYLPTSVKEYNFPFIVNCNFLLDAGREKIHKNRIWNEWLFQVIGYKTIQCCAEFAEKKLFKTSYLSLLRNGLYNETDKLNKKINEGLKIGFSKHAFIRNNKDELCKLNEICLDPYRIANIDASINEKFAQYLNFIENELEFKGKNIIPLSDENKVLRKFKSKVLDEVLLQGFFASEHIRRFITEDNNFKVLQFIRPYEENDPSGKWYTVVTNHKLILNQDGVLDFITGVCFPMGISTENNDEYQNRLIHESVYQNIQLDDELLKWLEKLGVTKPGSIAYLEKEIISNIDDCITDENFLDLTKFIFDLHTSGDLEDKHYVDLQELPLKTNLGFKKANQCILPEGYNPTIDFSQIINNAHSVTEEYIQIANPRDCRLFFKLINVTDDVDFIKPYKKLASELNTEYVNSANSFAKQGHAYPHLIGYFYPNKLTREVSFYLQSFSFIEQVSNKMFAQVFWNRLFDKFRVNFDHKDTSPYSYGPGISYTVYNLSDGYQLKTIDYMNWGRQDNNTVKIPNYFFWNTENIKCIPTLTGMNLPVNTFVNSDYNKDLGGDFLPIIELKTQVPEDWRKVLNLKLKFSIKDLLIILKKISTQVATKGKLTKENQKRIGMIYNDLLSQLEMDKEGAIEEIKDWSKTHQLISSSKKSVKPQDLIWIKVPGFENVSSGIETIYLPQNVNKKNQNFEKLLEVFGVRIIEEFSYEADNQKEFHNLKIKLLNLIGPIALILKHKMQISDIDRFMYDRCQKISKTKFINCQNLRPVFRHNSEDIEGEPISYYYDKNKNEFLLTIEWNNPISLLNISYALSSLISAVKVEKELMVLLGLRMAQISEYLKSVKLDSTEYETSSSYKDILNLLKELEEKSKPIVEPRNNISKSIENEHISEEKEDGDEVKIESEENLSNEEIKKEDSFLKEVEDFIANELEGTEWSQHIIELKELLQLDTAPGEQKKKVYNLLAKLKLAKNRNLQFESVDENDRQFNYLEGNGEKYIVHSARGSFAYIAPIELLKMRDEGYMMALDFGNKAPIKIYHQAEEILSLNTNHLLLYQNDKKIEDLFTFCEKNQSTNKRLLIIDKDHASNKSKELLKLMIPDEDY